MRWCVEISREEGQTFLLRRGSQSIHAVEFECMYTPGERGWMASVPLQQPEIAMRFSSFLRESRQDVSSSFSALFEVSSTRKNQEREKRLFSIIVFVSRRRNEEKKKHRSEERDDPSFPLLSSSLVLFFFFVIYLFFSVEQFPHH